MKLLSRTNETVHFAAEIFFIDGKLYLNVGHFIKIHWYHVSINASSLRAENAGIIYIWVLYFENSYVKYNTKNSVSGSCKEETNLRTATNNENDSPRSSTVISNELGYQKHIKKN